MIYDYAGAMIYYRIYYMGGGGDALYDLLYGGRAVLYERLFRGQGCTI